MFHYETRKKRIGQMGEQLGSRLRSVCNHGANLGGHGRLTPQASPSRLDKASAARIMNRQGLKPTMCEYRDCRRSGGPKIYPHLGFSVPLSLESLFWKRMLYYLSKECGRQ